MANRRPKACEGATTQRPPDWRHNATHKTSSVDRTKESTHGSTDEVTLAECIDIPVVTQISSPLHEIIYEN